MEEKDLKQENGFDINTDDSAAGTTHLNEPLTDDSEIDKLKEEIQQQQDKYLRLYAEFDNYKRRSSKEKMELIQTAGKDVIVSLLEVLDDCERAQKQIETSEDHTALKEGLMLVFNKLKNTLASRGVKAMESINTDFDADKHEAITEVAAVNENQKGKVIDEIQKGYYLNDKIIRFAKVVVGK